MGVLVKCSKCSAQLQAPQGATTVRCNHCDAVTRPLPQPPCNPCYAPPVGGRKKAVICGIDYKDTESELSGCINDAHRIKYLLISRFNFRESDILMLTEEEKDPKRIPTKHNMKNAMAWLVAGVRAGDSLVFCFSGHGQQLKDKDGDEVDGFDEYIWPLDFENNGKISDDEINDTIVKPIPTGAKLTAIIDSCSSGTVLDLPFLCRMNRKGQYVWEDHRPRSCGWKGTSGGEAIVITGCDDHQFSEETPHFSEDTTFGAMTSSFIQAIEYGQATTYGSLLNAIRFAIRHTTKVDDDGKLTHLTQEPQLSANMPFDVYAKPFSL